MAHHADERGPKFPWHLAFADSSCLDDLAEVGLEVVGSKPCSLNVAELIVDVAPGPQRAKSVPGGVRWWGVASAGDRVGSARRNVGLAWQGPPTGGGGLPSP
jgi:hypothetical protein